MNYESAFEVADLAVFAKIKRHLKDVEVVVLRGSWQDQTYEEIAEASCYSPKFLKQDVGPKLWKLLSEALGEPVSKTNFQAALERRSRLQEQKKLDEHPAVLPIVPLAKENLEYPALPVVEPELPFGPVPICSTFYVERPSIEDRCYTTISQPGALIRIKAPRQMGKTSLLDRILNRAAKQGYQTVRLNLRQAEETVFDNLDKFLRWFCTYVSYKLQLPSGLSNWVEERGSIVNCTTFFQDHILEQIDSPLVLALDEVDWVFRFPEITQGFFAMLRSWHEEAKTIDTWEKLRLVVVHSTEDYGPLDINQSPFNVGLPVELTEFTPQQVEDLARRHQLDWNNGQVQQLMAMVGGHPYLVQWALYRLARQDVTLELLLQDAPTDAGIYEDHLRRHWDSLQENPELAAALKQVVTSTEPVRLETMQAYKLYSMGLIKRQGDRVTSRCELYQQYFRERLSN